MMGSSSSSSSSPREVIQLSFGPTANSVTAHLLNVQGLAVTDDNHNSFCDPWTTHYVQSKPPNEHNVLVPRVLMIDEATVTVSADNTNDNPNNASTTLLQDVLSPSSFIPWQGDVQVLINRNNNNNDNTQSKDANNHPYFSTATNMAYSPYSRYQYSKTVQQQQQSKYTVHQENERHVEWDNDNNDDEEESNRQQQQQDYDLRQYEQSKMQWTTQTAPVLGGQVLQRYNNSIMDSSSPCGWRDIWMPPYAKESKLVLPYSTQSQLVPYWDVMCNVSSKATLPFLQEWKEDVLLEQFRHLLLEPCDYGVQGVVFTTEGCGIYSALCSFLLEEVADECKSACRWVNHIQNNNTQKNVNDGRNNTTTVDVDSLLTWQERQVARVRQNIATGLTLYDFTEKAHVVLPLRTDIFHHPDGNLKEWFTSTAHLAMALEVCGLPYRFKKEQTNLQRDDIRYQMGLQNAPFLSQGGSNMAWGSTTTNLSMNEYLTMLQPSSQYSMLEMDAILPKTIDGSTLNNQNLYRTIREGTSVERDHRMRKLGEEGYRNRPQDGIPGRWLEDANALDPQKRGLLSSLSYSSTSNSKIMNYDRTMHHHFSLTTAVRPNLIAATRIDDEGITMRNYLTCLVQGMGISYRPERSMATVVDQTLGQLTFGSGGGGGNYGAGAYWKNILTSVDTPVVAVLGNTTRAFGLLSQIADSMQDTVRGGTRSHGYLTRDVLNGVLPELDDCEEALEGCMNKRDLYHPPEGRGFDFGHNSD